MQFPPQAEKEVGIEARELPPAMDFQMTAAAERDVQLRLIAARPAMVHDETGFDHAAALFKTQGTAAVSLQDRFPVSAEVAKRMPAPVITGATVSAREESAAAAHAAPPRPLFLCPH